MVLAAAEWAARFIGEAGHAIETAAPVISHDEMMAAYVPLTIGAVAPGLGENSNAEESLVEAVTLEVYREAARMGVLDIARHGSARYASV